MKNKVNRQLILYILKSSKFKFILLALIILNFWFANFNGFRYHYFEGIVALSNLFMFNSTIAFLLILSTFNTINLFEEFSNVIIRYKNKREYLIELIKVVLIVNFVLLFINKILLITFLNFIGVDFVITKLYKYNILNITYAIYTTFRQIFVFELLSLVFLFIFKNLNKILALGINTFLALLLWMAPYNDEYVNSLSKMFIFIWDYIVTHNYASFSLEVAFTNIYCCILIVILYGLYKFTQKNMKTIGS